jgi:D-sedoheptulose 7-phosphate isomerase
MDEADLNYARRHLAESQEALSAANGDPFVREMLGVADAITKSLKAGGKVLLCGNGGSAADAQHIAAELIGRFEKERASLGAIALTTDTSILTAVGNDYGFDHVYERQVIGLGNKGDVLIGISTSGRSKNIIKALEAGRARGLVNIGFTGKDARDMGSLCDALLRAPSDRTAVIQQIHITAAHVICGLVERRLAGAGK